MHSGLPETLYTARLNLRPICAGDGAVIVPALNDLAVAGWLSSVPHPYDAVDFAYFSSDIARPGRVFAIQDAAGFAGVIGLDHEFGYWLAPRAQGMGYATEAARAVLPAYFIDHSEAVLSGYFEGNSRSLRVLTKLGFVERSRGPKLCRALGQDRPHVDVSLSRSDFIRHLPAPAHPTHLIFRALQASDADALHAIVSDWTVVRQLGSFPWPPDPAFSASRVVPFAGDGFVWGICLAGALIGTVAVTKGELGYMIAPAHHRMGFAQHACRRAIGHAFEALVLDEITAGVWADNAGSIGLLTKLGFTVTAATAEMSRARGVVADGFDMCLTRADWMAQT